MMPAAKHGDPQLGVDIHLCTTPAGPVPLPTPHTSVVFDPFDYVPFVGATVTVCGMKRATAGTSATAVHIPPGFPFAPMLPLKDDELFMGSATVVADGDPMSFIGVPVLSCQVAGMPSIPRPRKKGPKKMNLGPLSFNLAIPTNVFVGGPPTISMMGVAVKGAFSTLGKLSKAGVFKRMRQKLFKNMNPGFLKCTILRAEPVNILSGAVSVEQQDFVLPGRIAIEWPRVYASNNHRAGQCGFGWETPADARLELTHEGVLMHYPGVGPLHFDGVPMAEGDDAAVLELQDGALLCDVEGEYRVRTKEDRVYHFPKSWTTRAPNGSGQIALRKISDLCGNWLEFERSGGTLTAIAESAGRRLDFVSDQGRILEIALVVPGSAERHVYVRYDYDPDGDLVAVRDALNHPYTFAYDAHHMVRHTDRNGLSFYYAYEPTAAGEWRVVHAWGDGKLYDYRFEYLDALRERRITDSLGAVSIVKLNENDLPISEIDALGGMTIYEYDDAGRTIGVTDQDGHRTGYEYDERGNLVQLTRPDGKAIATQFDAQNKAVAITDPNGATWQQEWDARGLLLQQTTPLGHVSNYEYDQCGQLTAYLNPRGARTELQFDAYGNLARLTDAIGAMTRFGRDVLGNVTGKLDALNHRTLYRYDLKSRLTDVQLPSGSGIHCDYDPEDNLTRYVDEKKSETRLEYFGQGEIAKRVQPDGHTVEYLYDTEERLIGVRNQRGELYQLKRDALGRIVEEVDYWGQSRRYDYTLGGHIRASVDPLQRRIDYQTDPLGRILKKLLPHPNDVQAMFEESFEYDPNGNLIATENPHIRVERMFDLDGRLTQERQGDGFSIANTYDATGNRIERATEFHHGGEAVRHKVRVSFDALDQASEIVIDEAPPIKIERNSVGQIVAEQLSPSLRREIEYSAEGYLTRQRVRTGGEELFNVAYSYDSAGNLTERHDSQFGIDRFIYDPMGRITQHIDPQGVLKQYLNDPAGDRLQTRVFQRERVHAAEDGTLDWARDGTHDGVYYRFDRAGNLVLKRDESGELTLRWDANQRLVESCRDGLITTYQYDPLGRRLQKRTGPEVARFAWDGDALLADGVSSGEQNVLVREWVYFPDTFEPLALLGGECGADSILYYHNDPNGCPNRLTTARGEVKWAASYTAWGGITRLHVGIADQPIRLQGQFEDQETGVYYNRHRYYGWQLGQFLSQDPIGLRGGSNQYSFGANVKRLIDPWGLSGLPAGFKSFGQFKQFGEATQGGLHRAGFPGTTPYLQGSAVTGVSHETGIPFDVGRRSDFDVALAGERIFSKADGLGLTKGNRTGPVKLGSEEAKALGIDGTLQKLSRMAGGREVNVMVFRDAESVKMKGASLRIPTKCG